MKRFLKGLLLTLLLVNGPAKAALSFFAGVAGSPVKFGFSGQPSGYGISGSLNVSGPGFTGSYDSDPYYAGLYGGDNGRPDKINVFNTIIVTADAGYQINSIRSGALGLLDVTIDPNRAGQDATAWGGMGTVERWRTSNSPLVDSWTEVGKGVGPYHSIQKEGASYYDSPAAAWNYDVSGVASFAAGTSYAALDSYTIWSRIDIRNLSADVHAAMLGAYFDVSVSAVPEPGTLAMFISGLGIISVLSRRRQAS
jgi:hypothetical protein